jgi:hypothetical protein
MKNLRFRIILGSLGFLFIYLLGAFYSVTFNISNWLESTRFIVSIFGSIAFIIVVAFYSSKNK